MISMLFLKFNCVQTKIFGNVLKMSQNCPTFFLEMGKRCVIVCMLKNISKAQKRKASFFEMVLFLLPEICFLAEWRKFFNEAKQQKTTRQRN